jgi:hypothetical protein
MNTGHTTRAALFGGMLAAMGAPAIAMAQVSLATVVDLAERNSAVVRIDQA